MKSFLQILFFVCAILIFNHDTEAEMLTEKEIRKSKFLFPPMFLQLPLGGRGKSKGSSTTMSSFDDCQYNCPMACGPPDYTETRLATDPPFVDYVVCANNSQQYDSLCIFTCSQICNPIGISNCGTPPALPGPHDPRTLTCIGACP